MFRDLRREWSQLKRGKPGSRFQDQFDRNRREKKSNAGRTIRVVAGLVLLPVGVFFLAVPGPGLVIMGLGAVMIAREFEFAARVLDAFEVRGRRVATWALGRWQQLVRARRKAISR